MWTIILAALRAKIPAWLVAALLIIVAVWGAHEWTARHAAQIDAQGARKALAEEREWRASDRALAAESAAEAVTNSLRQQETHAATQTRILDELESKKSAVREWQSAYTGVVRARDGDAGRLLRLRDQLSVAAADADRRAKASADAATAQCLRASARALDTLGEGASLVDRGIGVAGRSAGLAVEAAGVAGTLGLELDAAERVIDADRALMGPATK